MRTELAEIIRIYRKQGDVLSKQRRARCEGNGDLERCPNYYVRTDGRPGCKACHCGDPFTRPRCPIGRWGITPLSECKHLSVAPYAPGGYRCILGHRDCFRCADRRSVKEDSRDQARP